MTLDPRAVQTAVIISIFAALGTLFVGLRLWTRFVLIRAPGYEDYVLISSWLCNIATFVTIGLEVYHGMGNHSSELSAYQNEKLALNIYICMSVYIASLGLTKLAILMQYRRVFPTYGFQLWTSAFILIIVGYTIVAIVACIFVCWPVQVFWKPQVEGHCINKLASWLANAILNIVTDFMIIILPMPVFRRLKVPKKQKWLLIGVFGFGLVVCIISVLRLHSLFTVAKTTDPSYDNAAVATWSVVEVNVALICACLPTLRPFLVRWVPSLNASRGHGTHPSLGGLPKTHRMQRSARPSHIDGYNMPLSSISSNNRGAIVADTQSAEEDDKIRVGIEVEVRVHGGHESVKDGRESSTESLWRDTKTVV